MAEASYGRMRRIFSKPPNERKDFEIKDILPWFRKKFNIFRNLDPATVFDILANSEFETKKLDDIIIRQGEVGHCMYVLLKGKVTVYIQYSKADVDDSIQNNQQTSPGQAMRHNLGTFVTHIVPGMTFGEVALMSEDSIRSASIISEETSELVVIHRDLYIRSVETFLKDDFETKLRFIDENIYFQKMAPRFRKQLAMALQTYTLQYDEHLTDQGDSVTAMYFIQSGEIELYLDASRLERQYENWNPGLPTTNHPPLSVNTSFDWLKESGQAENGMSRISVLAALGRSRTSVSWKMKPLCILAQNECIGDAEVLMGLNSYLQTSISKNRCTVLMLELKHFERLISKRNPRIQEMMHGGLESRLEARFRQLTSVIKYPFFEYLLSAVKFIDEKLKKQEKFRLGAIQETEILESTARVESPEGKEASDLSNRRISRYHQKIFDLKGRRASTAIRGRRVSTRRVSEFNPEDEMYYNRSKTLLLPPIADRDVPDNKQNDDLMKISAVKRLNAFHRYTDPEIQEETVEEKLRKNEKGQRKKKAEAEVKFEIKNYTSNAALSSLEERMKTWLSDMSTEPCQVVKFPRPGTTADSAKPGMLVVVRTKPKPNKEIRTAEGFNHFNQDQDDYTMIEDLIPESSRQLKQKLDFYRFALNAKIIDFEKR